MINAIFGKPDENGICDVTSDCPVCERVAAIVSRYPPGPFYEVCGECLKNMDKSNPMSFFAAIGTLPLTHFKKVN